MRLGVFERFCDEAFFEHDFETRHRHTKNHVTPEQAWRMASPDQMLELIRTGALRRDDFDVIASGTGSRGQEFHDMRNVMDAKAVTEAIQSGASLRLFNIHRRFPEVDAARRSLAGIFGAYCFVNGYLTPCDRQGFNPHYDAHEVFILQVSGRKRWTVFHSQPDDPALPLRHQKFDSARHRAGEEIETFNVGPGDVLYIPRGRFHAARALDDVGSFHLTFGVEVNTWTTAVLDMLESLADRELSLRKAIVPGRGPDPEAGRDVLTALKALSEDPEQARRIEGALLKARASDAHMPSKEHLARSFKF